MNDPIPLWRGVAPGSESWTHSEATMVDHNGDRMVRNVTTPTLTPYLPDRATATGTAVIVAPGGGFQFLSWDNEGVDVATWLAGRGVAAFVLKYRLRDTGPTDAEFGATMAAWWSEQLGGDGGLRPVRRIADIAGHEGGLAVDDAAQAVRLLRSRAAELSIDPQRIGFVGFSAGAFLATALATTDDAGARLDFVAPIYGGSPDGDIARDAPPLFGVVAGDDAVCFDASMATYQAWRVAGRPAELHIYAEGGHGFGVRKQGLPHDTWLDRLADWMTSLGFLPR